MWSMSLCFLCGSKKTQTLSDFVCFSVLKYSECFSSPKWRGGGDKVTTQSPRLPLEYCKRTTHDKAMNSASNPRYVRRDVRYSHAAHEHTPACDAVHGLIQLKNHLHHNQ